MKKIEFIIQDKKLLPIINKPLQASKCLPAWYNNQPSIINNESLSLGENGIANITIKKCMPVLDDMIAGYILTTYSDIIVKNNVDGSDKPKSISWSLADSPEVISSHSTSQVSHFPIPNEYNVHPFKFNNYWRIRTPPGYSCIFRSPFYHTSTMPFYALSGIVDTDTYCMPINFPFLIRKDFEGVIEADTPFIQIIPFKRTEWVSEISVEDNKKGVEEYNKTTRKIMHRYKDNWRSIKKWN